MKRKRKPHLGSKRRVFVIPALSITYLVEYNLDTLVSIEIIQKKKKKHVPVAQTTRDASFGPVIAIPTFPEPLRNL